MDLDLTPEETEKLSRELCHPVTPDAVIGSSPSGDTDYAIEVIYGPGVMDPEGRSAKSLAEIVFGRKFPFDKKIAVLHQRRIKGSFTDVQLRKIAGQFYNDIVQNVKVFPRKELQQGIGPYMSPVEVPPPGPILHYDLNARFDFEDLVNELARNAENKDKAREEAKKKSDSWLKAAKEYYECDVSETNPSLNLLRISDGRMLALNLEEMASIKGHYSRPDIIEARKKVGLSGKATDVELELFGQTWSEHCKHKIFNADVSYIEGGIEERIKEGIFNRFIKSATLAIQKQKPDFIKSVLWDNSGVVDIDPKASNYVCFKCETHNSPSFLEPYGGAITGIVGVYRDPLGTGRGSLLIFGVWGYCTGSIFYDGDLRPPLHPDQLIEGIHHGVRDGGNKHGVPNAIGGTFFDDGFMGKCLVYVGAAGLVPKVVDGRPGYEKWVDQGDRVIVVGGRVGKDGIHGAIASSEGYHKNTPKGHVQIGDPYTQKNVQEFMWEALAEGLINFSQDSGAGGTGSAAGKTVRDEEVYIPNPINRFEKAESK
ncbi:hypothetical protein COV19_00010 [Candidatus Woesearchaeota archaeon CG10_big_fil_rev_8_21_14_0_10_44_13]|nr:MAG: hypothetical protein COV19_00010 [Candidatus Woesearchaeota archaeon CG10_big_fil_rev_8_21_14_0_10_44_13]